MIDDTLRKMEERIRSSTRTSDETRDELLALLVELRSELGRMAETHEDDARTLARHAAAAGEDAEGGVEESVLEFETAHPRITGLVRSFLRTLADAGI